MEKELVSRKTRQGLREYFVHTTLQFIADAFDAANIQHTSREMPNISGERRTLVEQYYLSLDFTNSSDVLKFLDLYEGQLVELHIAREREGISSNFQANYQSLLNWISRDGFDFKNGKLTAQSEEIYVISDLQSAINGEYINATIERMRRSVETDPTLALGSAKELIETVCKSILLSNNITPDNNWKINKLIHETCNSLGLLPKNIDEEAKGIEAIKKVLGSLSSIAFGLAELRNLYGTGHGAHHKAKGIKPRHARLAVGSAATLVLFLWETHVEKNNPL